MISISNNNDFNNIPVVLETKVSIYLLLLECIILTDVSKSELPD